jgi:uncharacterized protein (TIGR02246 family)
MKGIMFAFILAVPAFVSAEYYPEPVYVVFGAANSKDDKQKIDQLLEDFKKAWASSNASAVAELHARDVEWINAFGRTLRTSADLKEFLGEKLFPMFESETSKTEMESFREISRRYIGSNVAVVNAIIDSERGSSVGSGPRKVAVNFVLSKVDGDWKIVQEVISDIRERRK